MSRPKKPTALKLIEGNRGKRKIKTSEPKPNGVPQAPPTLSKIARPIWDRVVASMPLGVFTVADEALLQAFVEDVALARMCSNEIELNGLVSLGSMGQVTVSPFVAMRAAAHVRIAQLGSKLGLDPVSRQNLNTEDAKEDNPFGIV